jgi:uncharacterized protein YyaL (SSP411 family)
MMAVAWGSYDPDRVLLLADGAENQKFLGAFLPFIRTVAMQDNKATAYVCRDFTCQLPVTGLEELRSELSGGTAGGQ